MYCIMIDDHETYIREKKRKKRKKKNERKKKKKKGKKKKLGKVLHKVDYFRIDENDFETDL